MSSTPFLSLTPAIILLLGASGCRGSTESVFDDDSSGPVDEDSGDDASDDDTAITADDDTHGSPYPDGLPDCGPYAEPEPWFEIDDFYEAAEEFRLTYDLGETPVPCIAHVEGDAVGIECDGWALSARWLDADGAVPLSDGDSVLLYATFLDGDLGTALIWVLDQYGEFILVQMSQLLSFGHGDDVLWLQTDYTCEYQRSDALPPSEGATWIRVYGLSTHGEVEGTTFNLDWPSGSATTDDGRYRVIVTHNYLGYYEEAHIDQPVIIRGFIQIVRTPEA